MDFDVSQGYPLRWPEGHRLHGLEVSVRSMPLGQYIGLLRDQDPEDNADLFQRNAELLAGQLISWNATADGSTLPATLEGVLALDKTIFGEVFDRWLDVLAGRDLDDGPLGGPLISGLTSPAPPMQMEPLSPSPGS